MEKTVGINKPAKKSLIMRFLGRMKINRFVLLAYLIMPALVIVVGFSAWTISGSSARGTDGLFIASDVVNSYDYIKLNGAPHAKFNLFETGFYDVDKKEFTTTPSIGIGYEINPQKLFSDLLSGEPKSKWTIYGIFTLKFPSGAQNTPDIFTGMTCKINETVISNGTAIGTAIPLNGEPISLTVEKVNITNAEYTALLKFVFNGENAADYAVAASLDMAYTLAPNGVGYQTLYNYLADNTQEKLMVDVSITKNQPVTL